MKMKNSNDIIAVPQPTASPRAPCLSKIKTKAYARNSLTCFARNIILSLQEKGSFREKYL